MRSLQPFPTRSFRPFSVRKCFVTLLVIALLASIFMSPISSSRGSEASRSSNAEKYTSPINGWLKGAGRAPGTDNQRVRYVGAAPTASPTPPASCCGGEEGNNKPHLLAGSYYTLKNNFAAKLLLNNKGPLPIEVQPTLYSLSGERFQIPAVTVDANAHRFINLRDWVSLAGRQFREGSMQLFHRGKDLVLGTQIYLTADAQSLSFEEKLTELGKGSSRSEGVWWLPSPKGEVRLVLSNTTDAALSVSAKIQGESPRKDATSSLNLGPHETRVLDVEADIMNRRHGAMSRFGALSIEHNGAPGAVLARAMALDVDEGFSLPVQFSNPAAAKSQNLQGAGLRIAKAGGEPLSAKVVVHNASQSEMTVTGRVPYAMKDGSTGELYLPQMQLSSGETQVIEVTQLLKSQGVRRNDVASAGLEFQHTGAFGSLITAAFSVSEGGNQVFRMPVWDVAAQRSATGGYPWYIEGDSSTLVYIKNATDQPRQFRMYIMYASGAYLYPLTTVAPRQTTTIDIRALRDHQVPDTNGQTIPLTEKRGQLEWSMTGGEDRVLIGRSEQVDLAKGTSSNYACLNCCGNSFYDGWVTPEQVSGFAGDQSQLHAFQRDANCYGQPYLPYTVGAGFNSFGPSICDSTVAGMTTGLGPGEAWIQGGWLADAWYVGLNEQCEYNPQQVLRDALCEIRTLRVLIPNPPVTESNGSPGVIAGQSFTIVVQAVDAGGNIDLSNSGTVTVGSSRTLDPTETGLPSSITLSGGQYTTTMRLNRVSGTDRGTTIRFTPSGGGQHDFFIYTYFGVTASREGLVGNTTACGHVITSNDHFVALPATGFCANALLVRNANSPQTQDATTVRDVGPWFPHSPGTPGNPCDGSNDPYWNTGGVPRVLGTSCDANNAAIDLADGTASTVGIGGLGSVLWRFD